MQSTTTRLAVLVLLMSSVGWGLTWLPIKVLNDMGLDGLHLVFIAFLSGAIVLSPWLYKQRAFWLPSIGFMLMIALAGGVANASFQTAIYHGDVIRVMILFYMLPVWSVIGGRIFLKEKIDSIRIIAVALCLSGAFLILDVWHSSWQGISRLDLLAIASGMGLAATNILFRFTPHIPALSKVAFMFIGCTLLVGGAMLVSTEAAEFPDNYALPVAVLYGAFWLTLITFGTQWAVTRIEAGRSAVIIVMELVVAVVSAALMSHSALGLYEILGGLMVIAAAIMEGARSDEETASVTTAEECA